MRAVRRSTAHALVLAAVAAVLGTAPRASHGQTSPTSSNLADMSMEELMNVRVERVFGAAKLDQKVTQAPASVSVVTAAEIRKFGYRTLADILRSLRGIYISYDSVYSYFGSRGFLRPGDYNSRVLLLVDGHRLNDDLFGQAMLGTEEVVDVDLIERVELADHSDSDHSQSLFGLIKYGDLSLEAGDNLRGKQIPVGMYGTVFNHPHTQNWDSHSFADLKYSLDVVAMQLRARTTRPRTRR